MSQLRTWMRRHAAGVVAEVSPVEGMGTWEASARATTGARKLVESAGRHFSLLTDAQAAADQLACAMSWHICGGDCDPWEAVERRKAPR
jgi:hypothetical protein